MSTVTDTFTNKRIGRYEIRERIGVGGMARVYKGWDTNLDRTVAIKILHEHLAEDSSFKERFEREAKLIASLNHPNIVQVYDFSVLDEGGQMISYMVMPYIPGKTLKEVLENFCERDTRMSHEAIRDVLLDVASALHYAHSRGMVHRDVKPANILFDEHDRAVLSDFGIARLIESSSLTQDGATVGTPTYISPEQAAGLPVDSRSDLYALGVMLYEMLAGEPPFSGDTNLSIILKHMSEPVPSISEKLSVSNAALDALIFKTMAKNPDDRFPDAQAFADALVGVFGGDASRVGKSITSTTEVKALRLEDTQTLAPTETVKLAAAELPPQPHYGMMRTLLAVGVFGLAIAALVAVILITQRPTETLNEPNILTAAPTLPPATNQYFTSSFSTDDPTNAGWEQNDNASVIRKITPEGFYDFESKLTSSAVTSIYSPNVSFTDGTVRLEGMLDPSSNPNSAFGIVFRFQDEENYNVFAVDGIGRYSIWELKNAQWHELRGLDGERWTANEFVNKQGEKNRLSITFIGGHFIGSVNDQTLADVTLDDTFKAGAVGVYLATYKTGTATTLIDTYQVSGDIPAMPGNS
jgi:serine/threonine protein kinase